MRGHSRTEFRVLQAGQVICRPEASRTNSNCSGATWSVRSLTSRELGVRGCLHRPEFLQNVGFAVAYVGFAVAYAFFFLEYSMGYANFYTLIKY